MGQSTWAMKKKNTQKKSAPSTSHESKNSAEESTSVEVKPIVKKRTYADYKHLLIWSHDKLFHDMPFRNEEESNVFLRDLPSRTSYALYNIADHTCVTSWFSAFWK